MNQLELTVLEMINHLIQKQPHLVPIIQSLIGATPQSEIENLNALWSQQDYIIANVEGASREFYARGKNVRELEHQVGRFLNMRDIAFEITRDQIKGDIVEFGTWQGLGLILFSKCFKGDQTPRMMFGIDSFEGLPESSTIWTQGTFNNTSLDLVRRNLDLNLAPHHSYTLIKGWFNDKSVADALLNQCKDIALVHFDADLGSSTTQALRIIEPYLLNRKEPMYFLFDDWGCHQDEVPDAFNAWLNQASVKFNLNAQKISTSKLTRNYKITFGNT